MYGLKRIKGKIAARSPLYSGGDEKTGVTLGLNRLKYLTEDGILEVPFISGNEVRGFIRRQTFRDFLDLAEYKLDLNSHTGKALFHTLMSGGLLQQVEEKVSGTIDLTFKSKLYQSSPPARLLGFSFGNQMLEGKLKVSNMIPICSELTKFLPDGYTSKLSIYECLGSTFQTRRDDLREERGENDQAVQMKVEHEVFCPGTQFYHEVAIEDPDSLTLSTLARMINLWKAKPYIGGKSSIGFGQIDIAYDLETTDDEYVQFMKGNKEEIHEVLNELSALFE